ncbi:MAG: AAA-associated domain-containing protein, partial [Candidatus Bathyarchaeota archaeon]|nr:AAA-associated domain-containing protein [Candidatus Bathyarchaeota archaeon]
YGVAAESMGLVELTAGRYHLTELGKRYVHLDDAERQELICTRMLSVPLIKNVISRLENNRLLSFEELQNIVEDELSRQSGKTKADKGRTMGKRRAQTVLAWFRWLGERTGEYHVNKDRSISAMSGGHPNVRQSRLREV